jgi:Staphylococcal nuclease homologue
VLCSKGVEPFGPEAEAAHRRLVTGATVGLELDVQPWDRYYRFLTYVYVEEVMVNIVHCRHRIRTYTVSPWVASTSRGIGFKKATFMTQAPDEATHHS